MQDHRDGTIYLTATNAERAARGLPVPWQPGIDDLQADPEPVSIPPAPPTDPEHGDLTPDYVRWFLHHHTEDECFAKYGTRLDKLPPDCRPD